MTKAKIWQVPIKDWDNFVRIVDAFDVTVPPELSYVYRGQSKASWELTPSFHRHFKSQDMKPETLLTIEDIAMKEFRTQAHLYISSYIMDNTTTNLDWWILMQHYHAPTRLLDWTESPFVAAYHACVKNFEHDGSIWVLNLDMLTLKMIEILGKDYKKPSSLYSQFDKYFLKPNVPQHVFHIETNIKTDRIVAQQGLFTVCCNISGDQHKIIMDALPAGTYKHKDKNKAAFAQLVIPCGLKTDFLKKLRAMNITASSLFPGLDGLGGSVRELVHLNAFKEEKKLEANESNP